MNLKAPLVVAGLSRQGLGFDAPDAEPVRLVFLVLTPQDDAGAQVQILGSMARLVRDSQVRREALSARTPTALLAAVRIADSLQRSSMAGEAATGVGDGRDRSAVVLPRKNDHHKRVTTERPHPTGGSCPGKDMERRS